MNNKEILQAIKEKENRIDENPASAIAVQKFLIFSIENKKLCFNAELVKEILLNTQIFFIPFCPPYVSGLINRHGEPYTVFDLSVLLENQKQESTKLIIMNEKDDNIAFIIKEIIEIADISQNDVFKIDAQENEIEFIQGFILI